MTGYQGLIAETVVIRGHEGTRIPAYTARPLGPGPHPGVVVIHHRHGFDWASQETARRFASEGYATIMPNLHHRYAPGAGAGAAAEAVQAAGGVTDDECLGDVAGALEEVRSQAYCSGMVGVIGYCSGGRQAYLAAAKLPFDATVVCYGGRIVPPEEDINERTPVAPIALTADIAGPVLNLSGAEDRRPSPEETAQVEAELKRLGKVHRVVVYPDAGHAFFGVDRDLYRPEAARLGWAEVLAWFERYLGGAA